MGFFDRFKKKQNEPKVEEQMEQPLTLQYSDGTVAEIVFIGSYDVDGKILHSARVMYADKEGGFTSRTLLLEPIMSQSNGQWIDLL